MVKKFSNIQKNEEKPEQKSEIIYTGDNLKIVSYKNGEFVIEPHMVIMLPYLRDEGHILLRHEYIPTYQYFYKDIDDYKNVTHFLTVISGSVEKGESLENAIRRELYEETGIILSNTYNIEVEKSLFLSKGNASQYHICMLELRYNDYKLAQPKGDGSYNESVSKTIRVSLGDIDELRTHDLITDYMITKFKLDYDLE